VRKE